MSYIDKWFINGQWVDSSSKDKFSVTNPADGSEIGTLSSCGKNETQASIEAAKSALPAWRKTPAKVRAQILRNFFDLIIVNQNKLAEILTTEQGKSLAEAHAEITYGASFVEWFAEEAKRIYGQVVPQQKEGQQLYTFKEPIGVVGAITPWNFPIAMITRKIAPALAAGCTVVLKPSEETPYSALECAKLLEKAGLPAGVVNIIAGDAPAIGNAITESEDVRLLTFTGSTRVGKMLMAKCANTVKKVTLELGGNSPFIVFEDADIDKAVEGLVSLKLRGGGQSCTSANRIYLHESITEEFLAKLKSKFQRIKVGNGLDKGTQLGPLINIAAVTKINSLVDDALKHGSKDIYSADISKLSKQSKCFYPPRIILSNKHDLEIEKTEIFGPVVSAFTFKTEDEVLTRANKTNYGLASYFYTEDRHRIMSVAEALEYGLVGANEAALSSEVASFGGIKESGIGREGGAHGIAEYLEEKYVAIV